MQNKEAETKHSNTVFSKKKGESSMKKLLAILLAVLLLVALCSCGEKQTPYAINPDEQSTLFDLIAYENDEFTIGGVKFLSAPEELQKQIPEISSESVTVQPNETGYFLSFYDNAFQADVRVAFVFVGGALKRVEVLFDWNKAWDEELFSVAEKQFETYLPDFYAELDNISPELTVAETLKEYRYIKYAKNSWMTFSVAESENGTCFAQLYFLHYEDPTGEARADAEKQLPKKK